LSSEGRGAEHNPQPELSATSFDPVEGTWVYVNVGGEFDFTDWGFVFRLRKTWKGTIYVDHIVFTP
jgi:hypothetical protein